jgi:NAD(P)-dependent dehydrogenase (short-subunit alcohol dehydrogenase family)
MKIVPSNLFSLRGKIALVTGGNTGIGRAIADGFIAAGADVWVHGCSKGRGKPAAVPPHRRLLMGDFTRTKDVERLVEKLRAEVGRLDILVNNAGTEQPVRFSQLSARTLRETMQVNAFAPARIIQGLLPLLEASDGASIVNLTSIHDSVPYPGNVAYSMSKAALAMLTTTLAIELAPLGIRVNNLAPGAIRTEINGRLIDKIGRKRFAAWIPAGRIGRVDEMVGPAIFLASKASSYCTGATLYADGAYMHNIVRYADD